MSLGAMPSTDVPGEPTSSRRRFLRTAAATAATGLTAALAGCSTRNLFAGVHVQARTQPIESPPVGLTEVGTRLVATGMDGRVVAFDTDREEVVWTAKPLDRLRIPAVGYTNRVVVAGSEVVALDLGDGSDGWRTDLAGDVATAIGVVPGLGAVAVGTESGYVHLLDGGSGGRLWQSHLTDAGPHRVDGVDAGAGLVYAGSRDGGVAAFDAESGAVRWRNDTVVSALHAEGPDVLLGRTRVHLLQDGDVAWSRSTENNWTTEISSTGGWYLAGTRPDGRGDALSLGHRGEERWRHRLTGNAVGVTPVLNGRLAVGVEGQRPGVHQFGTDGDSQWFYETETSVVDVVVGPEWVWALTASGELLALSQ